MPYKVVEKDGKYDVQKESDGSHVGTHDTRESAEAQIAAIEAEENKPQDPPPHPVDDSKDLIHTLGERVTLLESTVQGLLPENKDETPGKGPWTHRKFG
jgi:hypothetical protein